MRHPPGSVGLERRPETVEPHTHVMEIGDGFNQRGTLEVGQLILEAAKSQAAFEGQSAALDVRVAPASGYMQKKGPVVAVLVQKIPVAVEPRQ